MNAHPAHGDLSQLRSVAIGVLVALLLAPAISTAESDSATSDPDNGDSTSLKSGSATQQQGGDQRADEAADRQYQHHTSEGRAAYDDGNYDAAADHFRQAYEIRNNPNVLYNLGRALEQQGEFRAAIDAYTSFIDKPGVALQARRDALERIRTLRDILDMKDGEAPAESTAPPDDGSTSTTNPAETPSAHQSPASPASRPPDASSDDSTPPWGPILTISGGSLLASSAIFAGLTHHAAQNTSDAGSLSERRESARRGRAFAIVADTSLVVGLTATAIGAVIWVPRLFNNSDTPRARLRLSTTPHSVQLNLTF